MSVSGAPLTPEPPAERGFKIERNYFTLDGKPADPTHAKQNQRFVVVLKVTEPQPQFGRVIVADYLPAGFEIDNPHLVSSGDTGTLSWIADAATPTHTEFRDDRFTAAFDRGQESRSRCSRSLMWCARCRRALTCCRRPRWRTCTGPIASAAPRRARSRSRAQMKYWRYILAGVGGAVLVAVASPAPPGSIRWGRRRSAGILPIPMWCSTATASCCAPTPRRKDAGGCRRRSKDVDPRFLKMLFAYEDKRLLRASRRRSGSDDARGVAVR